MPIKHRPIHAITDIGAIASSPENRPMGALCSHILPEMDNVYVFDGFLERVFLLSRHFDLKC